jgi:hypothetical protein
MGTSLVHPLSCQRTVTKAPCRITSTRPMWRASWRSINEIAAAQFHPITNFECPLWVISRYLRCEKSCPVYPLIATEGVNAGFGQKLPLSRE